MLIYVYETHVTLLTQMYATFRFGEIQLLPVQNESTILHLEFTSFFLLHET